MVINQRLTADVFNSWHNYDKLRYKTVGGGFAATFITPTSSTAAGVDVSGTTSTATNGFISPPKPRAFATIDGSWTTSAAASQSTPSATTNKYEGTEALQMPTLHQIICQQFISLSAHEDSFGTQAFWSMSILREKVHSTFASATAYPDAYRRETLQVQVCEL